MEQSSQDMPTIEGEIPIGENPHESHDRDHPLGDSTIDSMDGSTVDEETNDSQNDNNHFGGNLAGYVKWGASSRWSSSLYCSMRNSDQMTIGNTHPTLSSNIHLHLAYPVDLHFKNDCLCTLGILRIWKQYFCNIRLGSGSSPSIPAEYLFNMPLSISHLVSSLHIGPPSTLRKAPKNYKNHQIMQFAPKTIIRK